MALVLGLLLVPILWSYAGALAAPGNASLSVRSVEWLRGHGAAGLVTAVENFWYTHHQPPVGGKPKAGAIPTATSTPSTTAPLPGLAAPKPIPPAAQPPLPGEGDWLPIGPRVGGAPAMYAAFLRPDAIHTSLVAGVAWMDPELVSLRLFAGTQEPGGGGWQYQSPVPNALLSSFVAAFNSGFRLDQSRGGYYANGKTASPLRDGAASLVIYGDGSAKVGVWGRDAAMSPAVESVRQNLELIVDNGQPVPNLLTDSNSHWGFTVSNKVLVWRSGVGVTANGAVVYAAGSGLSVASLADILARAGAVRAMELDINSSWVNFFYYNPPAGQPASPANGQRLLNDMSRSPSRYFSTDERDFFGVFSRSAPLTSLTSVQ